MSRPRHGSLCSGYGGLDMAAQAVFGGELAWWSDIHPAAVKVMAHHHSAAPNLGDLREVSWWEVPHVDLLTAGYPCQPFSNAGRRLGTDDPRHLWPWVARAIGALRPRIVVLENVAVHLGRGFDLVLADLAVLGYDTAWTVVRASDVGAPHRRARLFIVAADTDRATGRGQGSVASGSPEGVEPETVGGTGRGGDAARQRGHRCGDARPARRAEFADSGHIAADAHCAAYGQEPHSKPDEPEADGEQRRMDTAGCVLDWGQFQLAIRRWERVLGRPATAPTVTGRRGGQQLSPRFVEWMMGLPPGYVTRVPDLSRNDMLHALGNGVVPQCASWAIEGLARRLGLLSNVERAA